MRRLLDLRDLGQVLVHEGALPHPASDEVHFLCCFPHKTLLRPDEDVKYKMRSGVFNTEQLLQFCCGKIDPQ
jgi:hypothetical protein